MFCPHCGQEVDDQAVVCPHCGCATNNEQTKAKSDDASSMGYAILGFFFPIVGLILYLIWKSEYPLRAKSAGKGALIGFIVNIVFSILYGIILGLAAANMSYAAISANVCALL